jgi:hypothetical protein
MKTETEIGRLALRVEGEFWNAYWAPRQDSMADAVLLASIRMLFVEGDSPLKDQFMTLAKDSFAKAVQEAIGQTPRWAAPVSAPERERSGRG